MSLSEHVLCSSQALAAVLAVTHRPGRQYIYPAVAHTQQVFSTSARKRILQIYTRMVKPYIHTLHSYEIMHPMRDRSSASPHVQRPNGLLKNICIADACTELDGEISRLQCLHHKSDNVRLPLPVSVIALRTADVHPHPPPVLPGVVEVLVMLSLMSSWLLHRVGALNLIVACRNSGSRRTGILRSHI